MEKVLFDFFGGMRFAYAGLIWSALLSSKQWGTYHRYHLIQHGPVFRSSSLKNLS